MRRRETLANGEVYHIFNKSIAEFKIFNNTSNFLRIKNMIRYYQIGNMPLRFSWFLELNNVKEKGFNERFIPFSQGKEKLIQIIAYCLMPTHLHLILKQLKENGISIFMGNILNGYSRYFNTKYRRKGPLWEGRFKNVLVGSDEQLLHLTRYIHLNPVTAYLTENPEEWIHSSYKEYLNSYNNEDERICKYDDILEIEASSYREFVEDRVSYQRELANIKSLVLD